MNRIPAAILVLVLAVAGCSDDDPQAPMDGPDPDGAALWSFLTDENYRASWDLWPGTTEQYESFHSSPVRLTTYANDLVQQAVAAGTLPMPSGAIIVKEEYSLEGDAGPITAMYKVPGYDPQHNDWFWVMFGPDGSVGAEGRVGMCQDCHVGRAHNDYLWLLD